MSDFVEMDDPDLVIDEATQRAFYRGEPFTGLLAKMLPDGTLLELNGYHEGDRAGTWDGWYPDGRDRYHMGFFRNHPTDEWLEWHPDGSPAVEDFYDYTGNRLSHKRWDESGLLIEHVDAFTIKGIDADAINRDGSDVEVDRYTGRLHYKGLPYTGQVFVRADDDEHSPILRSATYLHGLAHGPEKSWYRDGTIKTEGRFRDGKAVGTWRRWRRDGTLQERVHFSDDGKFLFREEPSE
ncbi:hypothetical protein ABGB12_22680 [Actinocorallia sp. B10E7]|uniref:toxin-antitoxin system YwqK family antitoxin n=1 Tax=Actinocorallia sp. B10E7 TaxID=3153558 RepID=UPI00325D4315